MNRREFIRAGAACGLCPTAVGAATSRSARADSATDTVSVAHGKRVVNQAQYDDGSTPATRPTYEPVAKSVDRATVDEITAGRKAARKLRSRLGGLAGLQSAGGDDVDDGDDGDGRGLRVSRQSIDDGLRLVVDCPSEVSTDSIAAVVETVTGELTELAEQHLGDRETVDVEVRDQPPERLEADCRHTVGRFSDARYREQGVAMGAAARSETIGETASTGFRGLRDGRAVAITTAHTFASEDDYNPADIRGAELYQSRQPHAIGRCYAAGGTVDAAAVAVDTDTYPGRYLADPGGDSYDDRPIVGVATWEALEAAHAEGSPIYKQGAVSGRCVGRIMELTEHADGHRELGVDIHSEGGDSGGPYFLETDAGLLIAGIHRGYQSETGLRQAIFVGSVLEALGVDFY